MSLRRKHYAKIRDRLDIDKESLKTAVDKG